MLKALNSLIAQDKMKLVFEHLRNLLMCTVLLAAGSYQLERPVGMLVGSSLQSSLGYGVVGIALILIVFSLLDGIYRLGKTRYSTILKLGLIIIYIVIAVRIVVVTATFRVY
ncbi:hypothetical protein EKL30_03270 [Candidimonas sp. SYP-B2681]|uniref:hypothetical protein n=1 Tax=Candidimonas sp. SYP-B2681 TaxID=2497686 RepID=UPI000F89B548|nr:hypothetical protein [Candidimonas sp. SYP-B2681]RTZ48009.1 hypothetical protein EKL30_03270 [Candidimonas sp. SYP-B2681]